MEILDNPELIRRAYAVWFRRGETVRPTHDSAHARVYGLEYVALLGRIGILAVYRVRPTGALKRLKQWPAELDTLLGRIESVSPSETLPLRVWAAKYRVPTLKRMSRH